MLSSILTTTSSISSSSSSEEIDEDEKDATPVVLDKSREEEEEERVSPMVMVRVTSYAFCWIRRGLGGYRLITSYWLVIDVMSYLLTKV